MNKRLINGALLSLLMSLSTLSMASDVRVIVGDERGQGTLRKRGTECLVITPKHVIKGHALDGIQLLLTDSTTVSAELLDDYEIDVAILRPEKGHITRCSDQPFTEEKTKALLKQNSRGTLRLVDDGGRASLIPVDIASYDSFKSIQIIPRSANTSISKGFSGSVLYINRRPVGMLTSVEQGVGHVIQSATLNAAIDPFFFATDAASTLYVSVDRGSSFLTDHLTSLATAALFQKTDREDANFQLTVSTERREIESDTDRLVEYTTRLTGMNKLGDTLLDKTLTALGNSFVSIDRADENARTKMLTLLNELDPLSYFE